MATLPAWQWSVWQQNHLSVQLCGACEMCYSEVTLGADGKASQCGGNYETDGGGLLEKEGSSERNTAPLENPINSLN